jgi:enoyl-CoA hydratase
MNAELATVRMAREGQVARVTIDRPQRLNALNAMAKGELKSLMEILRDEPAVRVVVISGAGGKAFVAGTDIEELKGLDGATAGRFSQEGQALMDLIEHLGKPVIALIDGYALGAGLELALACHLRIASDRSILGMPEVNLGTIPGYGGTWRLARLVGRAKAIELILTGKHIDAATAFHAGILNSIVPAESLEVTVMELARMLADKPPLAIRGALRAIIADDDTPDAEHRREVEGFVGCCATEDFREGVRAFLNKQTPVFRGR